MKKMKLAFVPLCVLLLVAASCKSAQVEEKVPEVNPLALLSNDSSIYVNVPVQSHLSLTADLIRSQVEGLSPKDAAALCDKVNNVYIGIGTVKDRSRLEISSSTKNIPRGPFNALLKKSNGWTDHELNGKNSTYKIFENSKSKIQISLLSPKVLCASKNVTRLACAFDERKELDSTEYNEWVSQDSNDILFFITRPGQYLRAFIGAPINIATEAVYGKMIYVGTISKNGKNVETYNMTLRVHVREKKLVSALKSLISLSFGMAGGNVVVIDDYTLEVSGIELSKNQVEDLFLRDPITGKKYVVVGDEVIEVKE